MGAKKSKKHRKHGRMYRRDSKGERRRSHTAMNKMKTINWERKKAGLPPVDIYTAAILCEKCVIRH